MKIINKPLNCQEEKPDDNNDAILIEELKRLVDDVEDNKSLVWHHSSAVKLEPDSEVSISLLILYKFKQNWILKKLCYLVTIL